MLHPPAPRKAPALNRAPDGAARPQPSAAPREQELKLRLRPQDVAPLRARLDALAPSRTEPVDSIYLDTPDRRLARAHAALRLRALGVGRRRRWVQTLKTDDNGAAFSLRGEWETPAPGGRLAPARLAHSPLAQLLAAPPAAGSEAAAPDVSAVTRAGAALRRGSRSSVLAPVFRTRFVRTAWDIAYRGARIEAVIDEGHIEAGARSEPVLEAEFELKSGPPAAIWHLALRLCKPAGGRADLCLLPYGDSKAARGYRLAAGTAAAPFAARGAPVFATAATAHETVRHWLAAQMIPLLANAQGLQDASDAEFVHQARVALRRMRAGLELLDVALPAPLDRGLQRLANDLGTVRDWDVFCGQLLPRFLADVGEQDRPQWTSLARAAERRRGAAWSQLRRRLQEPAFAALSLRLLQWSGTPAAAADQAVGPLALKVMRKGLRQLVKAAPGFSRRSAQRQHRMRLQAKALRYGMDMLADVLPVQRVRAAQRALGRFQDAVGRARDTEQLVAAVARLTPSRALRRQAAAWARRRRDKAVRRAQRLAGQISAWH